MKNQINELVKCLFLNLKIDIKEAYLILQACKEQLGEEALSLLISSVESTEEIDKIRSVIEQNVEDSNPMAMFNKMFGGNPDEEDKIE